MFLLGSNPFLPPSIKFVTNSCRFCSHHGWESRASSPSLTAPSCFRLSPLHAVLSVTAPAWLPYRHPCSNCRESQTPSRLSVKAWSFLQLSKASPDLAPSCLISVSLQSSPKAIYTDLLPAAHPSKEPTLFLVTHTCALHFKRWVVYIHYTNTPRLSGTSIFSGSVFLCA